MGYGAKRATGLLVAASFAAAVPLARAWAQSPQPRSTCSTFAASNEPSSVFDAGEEVIVRGTGFGAGSLVFVRFEQGERSAELGRVETNDLGAFAAPAAAIPNDVVEGNASISVLDARASATCAITVREAAASQGGGTNILFVIWGALLAIFAVVLAVLTYRRWKSERLREAMGRIGGRSPETAGDAAADAAEPAGRPARQKKRKVAARPAAWELDAWEEEAAGRASFPIGPDAGDVPADADESGGPSEVSQDASEDEEWAPPRRSAHPPVVERRSVGSEAVEPPRLPVGWDGGRLRPNRQTSQAIERLRREVKTWGRS